jgi:hypothetical protein
LSASRARNSNNAAYRRASFKQADYVAYRRASLKQVDYAETALGAEITVRLVIGCI